MRIAYVVNYLQPKIGYQEYYLPKALSELGNEVCVFTSDRYYPVRDYDNTWGKVLGKRIVGRGLKVEQGLRVKRLACRFEYHSFCILGGLVPALQDFQPDIVQYNSIFSNLSCWLLARAKHKLDCGLVCDEHVADFNTNLQDSLYKKLYFRIVFLPNLLPDIIKNTDSFVAIGENERNFLCRYTHLSPSQVPIITLGVDSDLFQFNLIDRLKIRKKLKLIENDIVLFFCGKINPGKRIPILIKALYKLSFNYPHLKLMIIGKAAYDYQIYLENLIKHYRIEDRIYMSDFIKNKDIPGYISACDIGCWPGDYAISIYEVMSVGLPIIIGEGGIGNNPKAYLAYNNGYAVKQDNVDELAGIIKLLIEKPELLKKKGDKSRSFVEEHLSWTIIAKKYLDLYESIILKKKS